MSQATNHNTTNLSRRVVLAGLSVATVPMVAGMSPAVAIVDPIHAVIDEHRSAVAAHLIALNDDDDVLDAAMERADAALDALFTVAPTTARGAIAFIAYISLPSEMPLICDALECCPGRYEEAGAQLAAAAAILGGQAA